MKYYHIIYNSSESSMSGGTGFGIRTATEGTPESLLKAVTTIPFNDDWGSYANVPSVEQIKNNPECLDAVPKNYAVTSIFDETGKKYQVIARRAYVGFDYGFYKNGAPTRPGNYVIDFYVFEETPDSAAYQILYEKALQDSNHFIPASVRPTSDNEEMRTISIGKQPPLPVEDKAFTAEVENSLDKDVVKLFFQYLASKKSGKMLYVKATEQKALKLMADLYRMLDAKSATEIRTYVNHRNEGPNDLFDIYFILNDYPHPITPGGYYNYIDIDSISLPDTDEAKNFGKELEDYVSSSFSENQEDINDILRWLLMPEYDTVKKMSKTTNDAFFLYCIQPGNFSYDHFKASADKFNDEFLRVLADYLKKNDANTRRFDDLVVAMMQDATCDNVTQCIKEYHQLESFGFSMQKDTEAVKRHISECILTSPDVFSSVLSALGFEGIREFIDKDVFERCCESFISAKSLDGYMLTFYKYFLTPEELNDKDGMLFNRFMARGMDSRYLIPIIDDVYGNDTKEKIRFLNSVVKQEKKPIEIVWPYMEHYLGQTDCPDFLRVFEDKLTDTAYADMFYFSIKAHRSDYGKVEKIGELTDILRGNDRLKALVEKGYAQDGLYTAYKEEVKRLYKQDPDNASALLSGIKTNIKDFLKVRDESLDTLALYLEMVAKDDFTRISNNGDSKSKTRAIFSLMRELKDGKGFALFLKPFVNAAKIGEIDLNALAETYEEMNPKVDIKEMIDDLKATGNLKMMNIIVRKRRKLPVKEAIALLKEIKLEKDTIKEFMEKYYEKEYRTYLRNKKIKGFFKSILGVFMPKDKKEKTVKGCQ